MLGLTTAVLSINAARVVLAIDSFVPSVALGVLAAGLAVVLVLDAARVVLIVNSCVPCDALGTLMAGVATMLGLVAFCVVLTVNSFVPAPWQAWPPCLALPPPCSALMPPRRSSLLTPLSQAPSLALLRPALSPFSSGVDVGVGGASGAGDREVDWIMVAVRLVGSQSPRGTPPIGPNRL